MLRGQPARVAAGASPAARGWCPPYLPGFASKTPDSMVDLEDREDELGGRLRGAWNPQGSRLTMTIAPTRYLWDGDYPEVALDSDQVETLATFLSAGPPPPD